MESLNLNTLASSLPTANLQNAEKDLLNNFKAAALSITTLYRSSRHTSKRAYNAGYGAACQDLLMMIQQGVSVSDIGGASHGAHDPERGGMTIGKIMDWIEARIEAIKSREEEEEEDEEKEKEKEREPVSTASGVAKAESGVAAKASIPGSNASTSANSASRRKDQTTPRFPTANPQHAQPTNTQATSQPPSPSPPPPTALRPIHPPNPPQRGKSRLATVHKDFSDRSHTHPPPPTSILSTQAPHSTNFAFAPSVISSMPTTPTINPFDHPAGTKRRHAVMMMLDSAPPTVSIAGSSPGGTSINHPPLAPGTTNVPGTHVHHGATGAGGSRRRTRSSRGVHQAQHLQNLNVNQPAEAMDVEEDNVGRERKRVARR